MDILVPLIIVTIITLFAIKKFKPELWLKIKSKFNK